MAVTILVGLITSRLVLQALGASDVGIYSAVGSTVALVGVITGALSSTTVRFMNIEIGKANGNPNRMFNICHSIHLVGAFVILLLLETIGLWYINTKLNVPVGKEADAFFVFQVSTLVACLGIANVPFQSLFTVHERFGTIALVDIINTLIKLGLVATLFLMRGRPDNLRIYAVMMSLTTWISFAAYHILSARKWPSIVRWKLVTEKSAYKEVLVFNNYNLLSSASIIARSQGSNMLINAFFGTTTNAAYFYAFTLQNYVNQFVSSFDSASAPQITQNVGAGNVETAITLAFRSCRFCILLFLLLFFPFWGELDFLMSLWLGSNMPPETVEMARWTLLIAAVSVTSAGLAQIINAFGRIKWYKIEFSVLYILCLPAGYLLYKAGYPAHSILVCFIVADVLNRIIQFSLLHFQFGFPVCHFLVKAYLRPLMISAIMVAYLFFYSKLSLDSPIAHMAGFIISLAIAASVIMLFGFSPEERKRYFYNLVIRADKRSKGQMGFDRIVLKARFFRVFGRTLNLKAPKAFNEKIQWMKLYDHDPRYTQFSDKYQAKILVGEIIGKEHIIPTIGVWDHFDQIDFSTLPKQFVLKCTHDSGGLVICRNRDEVDWEAARKKIEDSLNSNYYYLFREWQYKDIPPRIIAEPYMQDGASRDLKDYKFYCFNGNPEFLYLSEGLEDHSTAHISFVTMNWERAPFHRIDYKEFDILPPKPECFDQMLEITRKLSSGFHFVRVDLYQINGKVYFGEMTFTPTAGIVPLVPDNADFEIGKLLTGIPYKKR